MTEKKTSTPINTDQNYWEGILEKNGLGRVTFISQELKQNGLEGTSLEQAQNTELELKENIDLAHSLGEIDSGFQKDGLKPCQIENKEEIMLYKALLNKKRKD